MKKITILGSTGSIGTQTLDVVRKNKDDFQVVALTAGSNVELLCEQIREFHPQMVAVKDEQKAQLLSDIVKQKCPEFSGEIGYGMDAFIAAATQEEVSVVVAAMVGMIGLRPVMEAICHGKDIALANKETLVTAGHIIIPLAKKHGVKILPVDSEHSAIFQSMLAGNHREVKKILLTASGGPFFGKTRTELVNVTKSDALKHPNWDMGAKITIDSATLMNKGLEVIEAKWLFGVDIDDIEVVVHRESIIHSMVEFCDNSIIGQMSLPSMKHPIQYAFTYPERLPSADMQVNFKELGKMTFYEPDRKTFRCLDLAEKAGKIGGTMPTIINAANEAAVNGFLNGKVKFLEIAEIAESAMSEFSSIQNPSLNDIIETDREVRETICQRF